MVVLKVKMLIGRMKRMLVAAEVDASGGSVGGDDPGEERRLMRPSVGDDSNNERKRGRCASLDADRYWASLRVEWVRGCLS